MPKKIFILLGHPDFGTLSCKVAEQYEKSALNAGHEVRFQHAGSMQFDPILHKGYRAIQELEPDLKTFQANVRWADHLVIVYSNWWGTMPTILKGIIDRAWLPGFAFEFYKTGWLKGVGWKQLLCGKTARVIILANTRPWIARTLFGDFTNELARATLGFAGIKSKITIFAPSEKSSEKCRAKWFKKVARLAERGK